MTALTDTHNRTISYLRLSVTDRCNLRCRYCMPSQGIQMLDHAEILTYEEMVRLVGLCLRLNMTKVRLTGGEPLVRRGIIDFARQLTGLPVPDLRLTTNGTRLAEMAADLLAAGVRRVNISLDTLDADKYRHITRDGNLDEVWAGLRACLDEGFEQVKVNAVIIRGFNDDEIEVFARLSTELPIHVRFIEFMPLERNGWRPGLVVSSNELQGRLERMGRLEEIPFQAGDGPARRFKLAGAAGELGLISPLSQHFCPSCNRLRLTPDGMLLPCLFGQTEYDLKGPLRSGMGDEALLEIIKKAAASKPVGHHLDGSPLDQGHHRPMTKIGG